jgi:hypothetical protein
MIIIHVHNAVGGAVRSTVEIRIDVAGEVQVERLTPAEIAEQEVEGSGEMAEGRMSDVAQAFHQEQAVQAHRQQEAARRAGYASVEQEIEGSGELVEHALTVDEGGFEVGFDWPESKPKPDPDAWKDKQGLK